MPSIQFLDEKFKISGKLQTAITYAIANVDSQSMCTVITIHQKRMDFCNY